MGQGVKTYEPQRGDTECCPLAGDFDLVAQAIRSSVLKRLQTHPVHPRSCAAPPGLDFIRPGYPTFPARGSRRSVPFCGSGLTCFRGRYAGGSVSDFAAQEKPHPAVRLIFNFV